MKPFKRLSGLWLFLAAANFSLADEPPASPPNNPPAVKKNRDKAEAEKKNDAATIPDATSKPVFTTNTITIAGERVTYVAETGMMPVLKDDGSLRASVFYIAYTRMDTTNKTTRPVLFAFNGGPGSSSVWLHLGALGPRRVKMNADGTLPPPPFALTDNAYSVLGASDLVFIDPVATGFSRAAKDEKADQFFGVKADLESVGGFIRLWTTRHDRWLSPKYLCGESYGTFRAAGLSDYLSAHAGLYLNGVILVSGLLDWATISPQAGNVVPYPLILPAYTAAAHFHKKLPPDLQNDLEQALAEARTFAKGEFASALSQGDALPAEEHKKIATELARLTGLKPAVIEDNHLRIGPDVFTKQLLHDEGYVLGFYDARIKGRDGDPASPSPDFDPSDAAVVGPFSAAMNSYVRGELKFENDLPYHTIGEVQPWKYDAHHSYPSAAGNLAAAMNRNPYLKVLVLGGRCDLVCPIDTTHYSIDHMALDPRYRTNITFVQFDAGHMMYINQPDLEKMSSVIVKFVSQ